MASLAESSVGSVPVPQIDAARQFMLKHAQASPTAPEQSQGQGDIQVQQTGERDALSELPNSVEVPTSGTANLSESQNAPRQSEQCQVRRQPPHLVPSASAPVKEMESMLDATTSQHAFRTMTKAASFHAYPDGDTQPMESQVYREYNGSMLQPPAGTLADEVQHGKQHSMESDSGATVGRTPRTCEEGDTGYIDLDRAFNPTSPDSAADFDELLVSPQTQAKTTSDSLLHDGFRMPETPALAGRKRGRDGECLTSGTTTNTTKRTPGFSQLFGMVQNGPMLSATQLFNQTQAPSSPVPDQLRSDPVVTRPSPNINGQRIMSSPPNAFSSPMLPTETRTAHGADPRETYTSMRESQERRAARLRQELGRRARGHNEPGAQDGKDGAPLQLRQQPLGLRRALSDHFLPGAVKHGIATRSSSRPSSASNLPSTIYIMETPATVRRGERLKFDDDFSEDDSEGENAYLPGEEVGDDESNDDDEYDELGQVLRSQANDQHDMAVADPNKESPVKVAGSQDEESGTVARSAAEQHLGHDQPIASQHSAILDSQSATQNVADRPASSRGVRHTSSASFVPGSQYAGRTSQDQARLAASQYSRSSQRKIASSPPLAVPPIRKSKLSEEVDKTSTIQDQLTTGKFLKAHDSGDAEPEVLESDSHDLAHSRPAAVASLDDSNGHQLFSTAQTHAVRSFNSPTGKNTPVILLPHQISNSQQSRVSEFSPRKAAGVRNFSEIGTTTPPDGSGQTQHDVDAVVENIMTAEDREYVAAVVRSPVPRSRKRQKLVQSSSSDASPQQDSRSRQSIIAPNVSPDHSGREKRRTQSPSSRVLRASPSKGNELTSIEPTISKDLKSTPESVRMREEAGAQIASQLLSARTSNFTKKANAKSRNALPRTYSRKKSKYSTASTRKATVSNEHEGDATEDNAADDEHIAPRADVVAQSTRHIVKSPAQDNVAGNDVAAVGDNELMIKAPERILALFKGQFNQFFPATFLAVSPDKQSYRIQFDDGTSTDIDTHQVCALDLRVGDVVKVNRSDMRKGSWIISGFGDAVPNPSERNSGVDIYGRARVLIQARSTRASSAGGKTSAREEKSITHEVLVTDVYLTHTMWKHYAGRSFTPPPSARTGGRRPETPSTRPQTPDYTTPGSRTRRAGMHLAQNTHIRSMHLREGSVASSAGYASNGIFQGMAFAVSYTREEEHKRAETTALIRRNGGVVLDVGFVELFDTFETESTAHMPFKGPRGANVEEDSSTLRVKSEYKHLGFVALIANAHHRKAKYIQALALGLPTLSARWISDCLDATKNTSLQTPEAAPVCWTKYLLPAGESSYLGGAVRSRTLAAGDAASTTFSATVSLRPQLMKNEGVLILPGTSKTTRDSREMFAFLVLALGAGRVQRVANLPETKAMLKRQPETWKWVYVDGPVADAATTLFGEASNRNAAGDKKRKRGQKAAACNTTMSATDGTITIVTDEFVIQSLILGALVD